MTNHNKLESFGKLWKALESFGKLWKALESFGKTSHLSNLYSAPATSLI
jgi:hypothetical protein